MSLLKVSHTAFAVLVASLALAESTSATYQKGTITQDSSSAHKSYDLKNGNNGYVINNCGDFQAGQLVDYRLKDSNLYIRREDGKEYKCAIEAQLSVDPNA